MTVLRSLSEDEAKTLLHKIKNADRRRGDPVADVMLDTMTFSKVEEYLAKLSEEENFHLKNRYRH